MKKKKSPLRILLIEDSDSDAAILQAALQRYRKSSVCRRAETWETGREILERGGVDLLLLDLNLPDTTGPGDTYAQARKWANILPIIILTNVKDHVLATEMVRGGAADFVSKDSLVKDPKLIQNAIDFSCERHAIRRRLLAEKEIAEKDSKQKDTVLSCFMGGYSLSEPGK